MEVQDKTSKQSQEQLAKIQKDLEAKTSEVALFKKQLDEANKGSQVSGRGFVAYICMYGTSFVSIFVNWHLKFTDLGTC